MYIDLKAVLLQKPRDVMLPEFVASFLGREADLLSYRIIDWSDRHSHLLLQELPAMPTLVEASEKGPRIEASFPHHPMATIYLGCNWIHPEHAPYSWVDCVRDHEHEHVSVRLNFLALWDGASQEHTLTVSGTPSQVLGWVLDDWKPLEFASPSTSNDLEDELLLASVIDPKLQHQAAQLFKQRPETFRVAVWYATNSSATPAVQAALPFLVEQLLMVPYEAVFPAYYIAEPRHIDWHRHVLNEALSYLAELGNESEDYSLFNSFVGWLSPEIRLQTIRGWASTTFGRHAPALARLAGPFGKGCPLDGILDGWTNDSEANKVANAGIDQGLWTPQEVFDKKELYSRVRVAMLPHIDPMHAKATLGQLITAEKGPTREFAKDLIGKGVSVPMSTLNKVTDPHLLAALLKGMSPTQLAHVLGEHGSTPSQFVAALLFILKKGAEQMGVK